MTVIETKPARSTPRAALAVTYAALCYLAFLVAFAWSVAFLADTVVPRTVDSGGPAAATWAAVVLDAALLGVFAVQHTVMARQGFKRWLAGRLPAYVERSTYVLASSAALGLVFWQWRPIPHVLWHVHGTFARDAIWALYLLGWLWVTAMTYAIDHWDLVGIRQVRRFVRGTSEDPPAFALPLPHQLVRHPMMVGFFPAFLAAPTMTSGHLLFAVLGCGYILVGVRFEERDLNRAFPEYAAYAARTPRFLPRLTRSRRSRS